MKITCPGCKTAYVFSGGGLFPAGLYECNRCGEVFSPSNQRDKAMSAPEDRQNAKLDVISKLQIENADMRGRLRAIAEVIAELDDYCDPRNIDAKQRIINLCASRCSREQ